MSERRQGYRKQNQQLPRPPSTCRAADPVGWRHADLEGTEVTYATVGQGPPIVFLHGWGLTPDTYRRALLRLAHNGVRVCAPTLPGCGSDPLPLCERTFRGYARWLRRFLESTETTEPVTVVGHAFGGGVAIQAAHDLPERTARVVLVNSIGGRFCPPGATRGPNTILGRTADLTSELADLADRRTPVSVLWGRGDRVISPLSFVSLRKALHNPLVFTVAGSHGWLIDDPFSFGYAMKTVLETSSPEVAA